MVWPKMFQAQIINCNNLFRPEPNRTEPDTGYCSSVTYTSRNAAHIHLLYDDVTYPPNIRADRDVNQLFTLLPHSIFVYLHAVWSDSGIKNIPRPNRSNVLVLILAETLLKYDAPFIAHHWNDTYSIMQ